jgi:hypothetical protein
MRIIHVSNDLTTNQYITDLQRVQRFITCICSLQVLHRVSILLTSFSAADIPSVVNEANFEGKLLCVTGAHFI